MEVKDIFFWRTWYESRRCKQKHVVVEEVVVRCWFQVVGRIGGINFAGGLYLRRG